jgi:hypothetical protein
MRRCVAVEGYLDDPSVIEVGGEEPPVVAQVATT